MLLMFVNIIKSVPNLHIVRTVHKYIFKMDKAYLRRLSETDQFDFTFRYVDPDLKIDRPLNFKRKLSETVETFLGRVTANSEKVINKKKKKKIKKLEEEEAAAESEKQLCVSLLLNGDEVPKEAICGEIFSPENNVVLRLESRHYEIVVNSPWVESITLPSSILATFPVYPSKFDAVFTEKSLSKFVWSKSKDKNKWTDVSEGFIYIPFHDDIEHYLKLTCLPRNETMEGPDIEVVCTCKVEASPGSCPFETRHQFTKTRAEGNEFRVVTYNILADLYCDSDYTREVLHPYCPPYALAIDYRKQLIIKEILGYNADLICLQEVDTKVFKYDLAPLLSHLGYGSNLANKGKENEVAEGLAFFYNKNRFKHLESKKFVFSEEIPTNPLFAEMWAQISKNEKLATRITQRSTTMQVNVVESLEHNEVLVVANTHLYFHPNADHIRLLHGGVAIRYLEDFVQNLKEQVKSKRISLIFCGDFNSVPECGIYKLYTTGEVPEDFIDYKSTEDEAVEGVKLHQSFKLYSACGTPNYTNYCGGFHGCLDYIYYETSNLGVTQVVPLPSHEEVTQNTALPSIVFPSDHLALVSDLKWL